VNVEHAGMTLFALLCVCGVAVVQCEQPLFVLPKESFAAEAVERFERAVAHAVRQQSKTSRQHSSEFPRNVTDIMRLSWSFDAESQNNVSMLRAPASDAAVDGRHAFLALANKVWLPTPLLGSKRVELDFVFGELALYSSAYADDGVVRFAVRGFYLPSVGLAFLVGAAVVNETVSESYGDVNGTLDAADVAAQDLSMIAFASNASAVDMLMAAARYDAFELLTHADALLNVSVAEFATQCYVKMLVRFDALPGGATNEHWRYRRTGASVSMTHAALRDRPAMSIDDFDVDAVSADESISAATRARLLSAIADETGAELTRLGVHVYIQSPLCGIVATGNGSSLEIASLNRRFRLAGLLELLTAAGQCWLALQLFNAAVDSPSIAGRLSMVTIAFQAAIDLVLAALLLVTHSLFDGAPNAWGIAACLRFLTFVGIGAATMMQTMYARYSRGTTTRRSLLWFVCRFYCGTTVLLFVINALGHVPLLLVGAAYSFWLPQILRSAYEGHTECPLSTRYIVLTTLLRSFEPLYAWACPDNLWEAKPNSFVWLVMAWLLLQTGVLLLQKRYGARALTPATMWKDRYDYMRVVDLGGVERTCPICLTPVVDDHMVTPCNHVLHRECLSRWMQQKLECPSCRAALPEP